MKNTLLPTKLKELRKAHSYTQDYVAVVLGIVRQSYSHYETGKRTPNPEMLYKLAVLYGISIDDLMHSTIELDKNIFYESPKQTESSQELDDYLAYFNNPVNKKRYQCFGNSEKELLYYFEQLCEADKRELIEFTKIKARKNKQ